MADISLRRATADDREELEALIEACYSRVYPGWSDADMQSDALPAMLRIDPALLESGRYFAATRDGRLAGCGGWSTATPGTGAVREAGGHIRHFATHPPHRTTRPRSGATTGAPGVSPMALA